jgi:hypothetical protein
MRSVLALFLASSVIVNVMGQTATITFEDKTLPGPDSAYYGQDSAGGFTSGGAAFNNQYTDFGGGFFGWDGFAYSNVVNTTTTGFTNQFAAYHLPGGGGDASANYGVSFNFNYTGPNVVPAFGRITLPAGSSPQSIRLTNTTYTALSMLNGDGFAKQFGGSSGNDPDFLLLVIQGRDAGNAFTGTVPFYLADFRFSNNAEDYVINQWTTVDLSSLSGSTQSLTFELTSSDVGSFGMNTPSYFALDNLVVAVPEPTSLALLLSGTTGAGLWWLRRRGVLASTKYRFTAMFFRK